MVERAFFAVAGLSVLLTSCAQTPSLTADDDGTGVDTSDTPKRVPEVDNQIPGSGPSISSGTRRAVGGDAGTARSDAGDEDEGEGEDASAASDVQGGADASVGRGAGGGAGGGSRVEIGVTRAAAGAGACSVPGDAQLEDTSSPTTVIGNGTPASCDGGKFVEAVRKGGVITFNCGPDPVTIQLHQTARVDNFARNVVIDGGGKVVLSGGGARRILYQNTCDESIGWSTAHCDNQDFPRLTVQNLTFADGDASSNGEDGVGGGGAIFVRGGRLKIVNSHFFRNKCAGQGQDVGGGAVRALAQYNNQPVYIVNSTFGGSPERGNEGSNGGAISAIGVNYVVIGSTLTHNRATGNGANPKKPGTPGGGSGGAIYNDGTDFHLRVCGSDISHNRANEHGGGIFFVSNDRTGTLRIENSTMSDNPSGAFSSHTGMYVEANGEPSISNTRVD